jgi:putative pyruvate formate lyase activating enzyme
MESSYLQAWKAGLLATRIEESRALLAGCTLCPRRCGVDRLAGERGVCRTGTLAEVASYGPHFGEESVLVGEHGSGTIFFCGCSLTCAFCQNYEISHPEQGSCEAVDAARLGGIMVELQHQGCHNINLVTPSHVIPQILASLPHAIDGGLTLPLVYNCSGYEEIESLKLLEGIVDIYMPDFKFWQSKSAKKYAHAADYPEKARAAFIEMQRQVGDLEINAEGLAERGLMVRHLLMPHGQKQSREILRFLAESVSRNCFVNIMDQYRPCGKISTFPELQETIAREDYQAALAMAAELGLTRLDVKDFGMLMRNLFRT